MAEDSAGAHIGRRLREIRTWRGLSVRETAELAGFTKSYLSMIEHGQRPVDRRDTLERIATALQVAPSELTGTPLLVEGASREHSAVAGLRTALDEFDLDDIDDDAPPWPSVQARVDKINKLRSHAEYAELGAMLPDLVGDLYASLNGQNRRSALVGLADCYMSAVSACKNLGFPDLAKVAALRIRDVTHLLSGPEWAGLAAYARGQVIGSGARQRAGALASRAAEEISGELARPEVAEVYGMLHLMAALSHTTRGQLDTAQDHVTEAAEIAARPGVGNHNFMRMWFGSGNVGFWQTALAVERGEAGKAMEIARGIDPATMPASASRQAMWRIDLGRAMALDRRTRDQAASHFLAAEGLAPQLTRSNPWVRETVTSLLGRARRDAGGRDLRGLAYRIGIAG